MLLSLCMIVKNEENNLDRCLNSVKNLVDEMIIVDTGSSDSTVKIAEKYGAKVFFFDWNNNFSDARNFSLKQAIGDWILLMDADDQLDTADEHKIVPLLDDSHIEVYLFQTLSYVGKKPGLETVSNLNVRLIKNHRGYQFNGAIHEQIVSNNVEINKSKVKIENIKIYHYGYLQPLYFEKNKPKRNMEILEKLLKNDNNDSFHLFNMGNEYLRLRNYNKALEFYGKSYENFNPNAAFTSKLLLRMILVLDKLNMTNEEMTMLDIGLKYYPKFTDLEYLRADLFHRQKKYTLAIKGYEKCMEMGDPPIHLTIINDVGTFKPSFALAELYFDLEDYDEAYNYYIKALSAKPTYHLPIYRVADIFTKQNKEVQFIRTTLEGFFPEKSDSSVNIILGDIFFSQKRYDIALEFFIKAEVLLKDSPKLYYSIGMSYLYLKKYKDAYRYFEKNAGAYKEKSIYKMILCEILTKNFNNANILLTASESYNHTLIKTVYEAFKNLMEGKTIEPISIDSKDEHLSIIIILLDTLLNVASPEIFEKALHLLNLVENDEALLMLAKLYYKNGYTNLAYQEFIRSIKMFDKIDSQGLEIMTQIMSVCK